MAGSILQKEIIDFRTLTRICTGKTKELVEEQMNQLVQSLKELKVIVEEIKPQYCTILNYLIDYFEDFENINDVYDQVIKYTNYYLEGKYGKGDNAVVCKWTRLESDVMWSAVQEIIRKSHLAGKEDWLHKYLNNFNNQLREQIQNEVKTAAYFLWLSDLCRDRSKQLYERSVDELASYYSVASEIFRSIASEISRSVAS